MTSATPEALLHQTIAIDQINVPTAATMLATVLREKILKGDLLEGVELPSERELGGQAGVSRATVREALRILESEGLIEIRLGRRGGSSVRRPSSAAIERSVGIFIRGKRIRLQSVLETRGAIEPAAARYAALHRTDEDLLELERCQAEVERAAYGNDVDEYVQANLDWHVQVVRASKNELLIAFISAVAKSMYIDAEIKGFNSPGVRGAVVHAHRRVMDAIREGDGEAAARRMARHVDAYTESVRSVTPSPRSEKAAAPRRPAAKRPRGGSLPSAKAVRQ
jgi:GntR family transcriptional regulator, transcriptional repressor for pyruvate dehydrogenase complex